MMLLNILKKFMEEAKDQKLNRDFVDVERYGNKHN
jgi:hypothetical protein